MSPPCQEQEEQLERVPICTDCVGAGAANPFEVIPEEALNQGQQIIPLLALHGSNSLHTTASDTGSATGFQQVQAALESQSDTFPFRVCRHGPYKQTTRADEHED